MAYKQKTAQFSGNGSKAGKEATSLNLWGAKNATQALDWSSVDARLLACSLAAAASADAAMMFGVAQGGRGVVITVFLGTQRAKTYVGTVQELEEALAEVIASLASSAEDLFTAFGLDIP